VQRLELPAKARNGLAAAATSARAASAAWANRTGASAGRASTEWRLSASAAINAVNRRVYR